MLIAGDIGGTKTDLAIYASTAGPHAPLAQTKVPSADYPSLQAMVREFLTKAKQPVDSACFAIAGPVIEGRVKTTNLPWIIEQDSLAQELSLDVKSVHLINDLEAIAYAVPILRPDDVSTINVGNSVPKGTIAVIAPGTGLGESFLTWDGSGYLVHGSEGGHSDFAPTDKRQSRLLEYMLTLFDHASFERVCSGMGMPNLYKFLRDSEHIEEEPDVASVIAAATDPTAAIVNQGLSATNRSRLCAETIDLFISILASEAGNLALKVLATGGLYIAGGVAVHTLRVIQGPAFMQHFKNKGRFAELMGRIPIHVMIAPAGIVGAAACGLERSE
jgi:glucokinase